MSVGRLLEFARADGLVVLLVVLAIVAIAASIVQAMRRVPDPGPGLVELARAQAALAAQLREFRAEIAEQARGDRQELSKAVAEMGRVLTHQMGTVATVQNGQIDTFAQQLVALTDANERRLVALREGAVVDAQRSREELARGLIDFAERQQRALDDLAARNDARFVEMREGLDSRLRQLQHESSARLDEMRRTVDEKLHATLEQRLGNSFRLVSERLEQVHKGLGEMHALAADVGDLKRVLGNVKTRGTWGEVQLRALLEQLLVPEQFAANVEVVSGSGERVEFAIRLPGRDASSPVWLPIDAKFPREDYERLITAQERADPGAAELAARQLEARLRGEAKAVRRKYVAPPATTDFALIFLPTEGLYAEVVRRAGLVDDLQRVHRVVVAGPTNLAAILSSLQMGFRTLAVERRTSEVWQLLGAVKTEFGRFGEMLARTREQLERAASTIGRAESRSRVIGQRLREVESLPEDDARRVLGDAAAPRDPARTEEVDPVSAPEGAPAEPGASDPEDTQAQVQARVAAVPIARPAGPAPDNASP